MTKTKHTPGPWTAKNDDDRVMAGSDVCVAECGTVDVDMAVGCANARLIAAAPEMLEALKGMIDLAETTSPFGGELQQDRIDRIFHFARAAIAKAEGRE